MQALNSDAVKAGTRVRGWRLAAIAITAGLVPFLAGMTPAGPPQVGQPAPALKVTTLKGEPFELAAHKGQVVIVNFWATWCTPCRTEMPALNAYYQAHHDQGLELLGVSIDDESDRPEVEKVMQQFSFPAALMRQAQVNGFGSPVALPFTYVVDSSGVIRGRIPPGKNVIDEKLLTQMVTPLLKKH